jgi:hypothetical protein
MRNLICLTVAAFLGFPGSSAAVEERHQSAETQQRTQGVDTKLVQSEKTVVPLKVAVVFNEYDGEKKVSSLPYVLFLKAEGINGPRRFVGVVRMGVRVPIWTGSKESAITYQDVGTNLDCSAQLTEDGRYVLDLTVERSSVYPTGSGSDSQEHFSEHPLIRTFRASLALMLRDGQTSQSTVATDPLNGHIVKVDVTLNVLK